MTNSRKQEMKVKPYAEIRGSLSRTTFHLHIPDLLREISRLTSPGKFKNAILELNQLYFEGLVESAKKGDWERQSATLEGLMNGTGLALEGFYCAGRKMDFGGVREIILPLEKDLINYGSESFSTTRHLQESESEVAYWAEEMQQYLGGVDTIVPIASGGFEPGILLSRFSRNVDLLPVRYSYCHRYDKKVRTPTSRPTEEDSEKIKDKRVLVVEDWVCGGISSNAVMKWTKRFSPQDLKVTAVVHPYNLEKMSYLPVDDSQFVYEESNK